jgi:hypothetical protein
MNLLEKLATDPIISDYLSHYSTNEKSDAIRSTLLYGICSLKIHYNNPLPMTLLNETLRKVKVIVNGGGTRKTKTPARGREDKENSSRVTPPPGATRSRTKKQFKYPSWMTDSVPKGHTSEHKRKRSSSNSQRKSKRSEIEPPSQTQEF